MRTGIIIPAYNAGKRLSNVLLKSLNHVPAKHIYVVDDGSTDSTADVSVQFGVVLFQHSKNLGKGEALKSGFRLALSDNLDGVFTIDGDGQHDPDCIPDFVSTMEATSSDLIIGLRRFRIGEMPLDRVCSNVLSSLVASIVAGKLIKDSQCGYRLLRSSVVQSLFLETSHFEFETEFIVKAVWNGWKISYCPIEVQYNGTGSHIRRWVDTKRFCKLIIKLIKDRYRRRDY